MDEPSKKPDKAYVRLEIDQDVWQIIKMILIIVALVLGLFLLNKVPADDTPTAPTCDETGQC